MSPCRDQTKDLSAITFAFDRRAENNFLVLVVDDGVRQDLELTSGPLEQVHVLRVGHDGLAEVDAAVDNRLLLLALQNLTMVIKIEKLMKGRISKLCVFQD